MSNQFKAFNLNVTSRSILLIDAPSGDGVDVYIRNEDGTQKDILRVTNEGKVVLAVVPNASNFGLTVDADNAATVVRP